MNEHAIINTKFTQFSNLDNSIIKKKIQIYEAPSGKAHIALISE